MYEYKPDYEKAKKRIDAFWECSVIDRALTYITFPRPDKQQMPLPPQPDDVKARRLDAQYRAALGLARAHNTVWYADSMPVISPTFGPATVAGYFGAEMEFDENNSWAVHGLTAYPDDLSSILQFDPYSFYFRKSVEVTQALRAAGKGKFITGIQEWLSPADILSAVRGPDKFCLDLIESPDTVKQLSERLSAELISAYHIFYGMARQANEPASNWLNLVSDNRYLVIQNDVSSLLSPAMFDEFLLPYTQRECRALDHTMYHLDGLQALKDLDRLLEIPELDAIQWGPPPQHWDWHQWVEVYKRIQSAGKGFFLPVEAHDLDDLNDSGIHPQGAWLIVSGIADEEEAKTALRIIEKWK